MSFLFYLAIARILTRSEVGDIALLATVLAVFNVLTQLALPVAATRFISSYVAKGDIVSAGSVSKTTLHLLLMVSGPGLILAVAVSSWFGETFLTSSNASLSLVITFSAAFLLDITALYGAYFLGLGRYAERVYQNLMYVPLSRGIGIILAYSGLRVLGVALGWLIGASATILLTTVLWHGRLPTAASSQRRSILAFSIPVFASAVMTMGQGWGDILLLQLVLMEHSVTGGYYLVVSSVGSIGSPGTGGGIGFLSILWIPLCAALYPALAASYLTGGAEAAKSKLSVAFKLSNLTSLPLGVSLAALAPTALTIAYGPEYVAEASAFGLLALSTLFAAQGSLLITTLQALGLTRKLFRVTLAATLIDLTTVALTASMWGIFGAALGRVFLSVATTGLAAHALRPRLSPPIFSGMGKAIPLAASVAIPLALTDRLLANYTEPLLRLPLLLSVFMISLAIASRKLGVLQAEDFASIEKALPVSFRPILRIVRLVIT